MSCIDFSVHHLFRATRLETSTLHVGRWGTFLCSVVSRAPAEQRVEVALVPAAVTRAGMASWRVRGTLPHTYESELTTGNMAPAVPGASAFVSPPELQVLVKTLQNGKL